MIWNPKEHLIPRMFPLASFFSLSHFDCAGRGKKDAGYVAYSKYPEVRNSMKDVKLYKKMDICLALFRSVCE